MKSAAIRLTPSFALCFAVALFAACGQKAVTPASDSLAAAIVPGPNPGMRLAGIDAAGRFTLDRRPASIGDAIEPCRSLLVRCERTNEALAALTNLVETVLPRGCSVLARIGPIDDTPFFDVSAGRMDDTPGLVRLSQPRATTTSDGVLSWTAGPDIHHCTLDARATTDARAAVGRVIQSAGKLAASRPGCSVRVGFDAR